MNYKLTIAHLYPQLLNLYGDRGNIECLLRRCQWRGIEVEVKKILPTSHFPLPTSNLLFMGGGPDSSQKKVAKDLKEKGKWIKEYIEDGGVALFICGAYQLMGHYYRPAEGPDLPGVGLFDLYTQHFGKDKPRCIGNIAVTSNLKLPTSNILVGFENHGGRTYFSENVKPLGTVISGFGNNGEDKTEGAVCKNAFGTYLHGPLLPKNPHFADFLIKLALERKYKKSIKLEPLDDSLEQEAHRKALEVCGIK